MNELLEDGRIVKGVNTTVDVGPDEIKTQAAKFGNKVDRDGRPPTMSKKAKGSSTNVLYNLGLAERYTPMEIALMEGGHTLEEKQPKQMSRLFSALTEGYKLQLERDKNVLVLNIVDNATGKRTEVRGKPGYETNGYDSNDPLHKLLDVVGKSANISELMNGEVVTINPKHPDAERALAATDRAYNEAFDTDVEWISDFDDGDVKVFATKVDDAYIELTYKKMTNGDVYIAFSRGGRSSVTGEGGQNKIFGAVINHIQRFVAEANPKRVIFSAFKPSTGAFGSQDTTRSSLYRRMVQRFASQNGYAYDVEDTGNEDTFILTRKDNTKTNEVLDSTAKNAKWTMSTEDMSRFEFTASNGVEYEVDFLAPFIGPDEIYPTDFVSNMSSDTEDRAVFVEFSQKNATGAAKQGVAGTGAAAEIFGIVTNAILNFAKKRKPPMIYFQAAEVNRRKLYAAIVRRLVSSMSGYTAKQLGDKFAIYSRSLTNQTESLQEDVAWQNSVSKHIFDFEGDDFNVEEERFLLPISSSILSRLGAKEVRSTVFHVTNFDNLDAMIKNQNTKKALSTFFHMDTGKFSSGVVSGGGLVFELDANVLMAAPEDIETKVDEGGRRWIPMEFVAKNDGNVNLSGMYDDVPRLLASLIQKYTKKPYDPEDNDVYGDWKKLGKTLNSKGDGKTLNLLIKDFMDGIYEIYQKHKDQLMKLLRHHLADRTPMDATLDWDEIIANEYKIKKIHVLDSVTLRKNPQVMDRVKSTGIEYDIWKKGSQLGSHIKKTVDKEKSEYVAQQQKDNPTAKSSNFVIKSPAGFMWDEFRIFNLNKNGKVDLGSAVAKLSPEEQEWAKLRWQQGLRLGEIGKKYNLNNTQAIQKYKPIHDKIRQHLGLQESIFSNLQSLDENFADGKKPGRKGLSKRVGIPKGASVTQLRKIAKNSTGERRRMAHWQANMKSGRKKS